MRAFLAVRDCARFGENQGKGGLTFEMAVKAPTVRVLCLACSAEGFATLENAIKSSRYSAITVSTSDQAVAVCVSQFVAAAVVDAESIRDQEWSVVKTLKGIRASLPVILLEERNVHGESPLPDGVDAIVSMSSAKCLYDKLDELIKKAEHRAVGGFEHRPSIVPISDS